MHILSRIVEQKRREVEARKSAPAADASEASPTHATMRNTLADARDFAAALRRPGISIIAEIKRRSPSKGVLHPDADVAAIARAYESGGAAAVSVLTDQQFFGGRVEDLTTAKAACGLPILRKDFMIDELQFHEARRIGADAVLLIASVLDDADLRTFLKLSAELRLAAMVEVHDREELARALGRGAAIVGVNNRDLKTFETRIETSLSLIEDIPDDCVAVAESGIHTSAELRRLRDAGFDAALIGESLMTSPAPGVKLAELLGGNS